MSRIRIMVGLLGTAALTATGFAAVSAGPARAASGAAVSVWETTADQGQLLAPQAGAAFAAGSGVVRAQLPRADPGREARVAA